MQDMALLSQISHDPLKNTILRIIYRFQSRTRDWRKYLLVSGLLRFLIIAHLMKPFRLNRHRSTCSRWVKKPI